MKFSKVVLGLILALSVQVHAEKVDVDFRNLSISDFIKMVGKITGNNILVDGEIKGKINFVSNQPIEKSELIPLANAILETKKMTLVKRGNYYHVVKSATAASTGLNVSESVYAGPKTMKTVIFELSNVNSAVIRTKIKPLVGKSAKIISFKKNNLLAITAYPKALEAVKKLLDKIEHKKAKQTKIVRLQNARVKDIFPNTLTMSKALFPQDIISEKVDVMQDIGGNAVILVGKIANVNRIAQYIKQLDLQGEEDVQKMHVIPLSNSNVEEMEKILSKIVPQMTGSGGGAGATPTAKNGKPIPKAVIASDLERNALIVLANEEQYRNILATVQQLDIEKAQVYIQAKIVEVNTNLAENIGLKYGLNGGAITPNGLFSMAANAGAPALSLSQSLLGFLSSQTTTLDRNGNAINSVNRAFEFDQGISKVFALGLQLDLLKQNGAAQILSKPSILSTNNKESSIYVGRTQSILTQAQQSTQGASAVINNYSREDIGITLKVKPRLSSNNKVSLEIETTIEDIVPGSGSAADRPTTTKRSVQTTAIINHAETIILGGLIKSSDGNSVSKIPILGDIPIIGRFFTSNGQSNSKVNVVIYITPYIIKKSSDLATLREHLDELESVQQQYNKILMQELNKRADGTEVVHPKRKHVTFNSTSNRSQGNFPKRNNNSSYAPVIERTQREQHQSSPTPNYNTNYSSEKVSVPKSVPSYTTESDYIRSESIMDTFNAQAPVDLDSINTGIEYNEGTTFTDVTPTYPSEY